MVTRKKTAARPEAVVHLFEGDTADECASIRGDVDTVLANISNNAITPTTSNDALLSLYVIPDKIQFIYVVLNQALSRRPDFSAFHSSDIKPTATVGDVRAAAYAHCHVTCSHI